MREQPGFLSILIAVRHPLLMRGLRDFLAEHAKIHILGACCDGMEGLALAKALRPDVCILDLKMTRIRATEFIKAIRAASARTRTLVLADQVTPEVVSAIRAAGGEGVCSKDEGPEAVLDHVRRLAAGGTCLKPDPSSDDLTASLCSGALELTLREMEIAAYVAAGFASKEVARKLHVSEGTVKVHLSHIYRKIGVCNRTALGYVLSRMDESSGRREVGALAAPCADIKNPRDRRPQFLKRDGLS